MTQPTKIEVRGGQVHNLKNIDVDIPLNKFVAISGLSGSGKSSLAMGILYEEGSRRYLEALSTYTRRRIKLGNQAAVRQVKHIPSALALHQRPSVPTERATVGTMSEVFNVVRLIFSRLGSPRCPNGHQIKPSLKIAEALSKVGPKQGVITCPICHVQFKAFEAQDFSFNSTGACPECHGTGKIQILDESKLILDPNLTIKEGAVAPWHLPGRNFMPKVAEFAGIPINIPYKDLTDKQKHFVLYGPKTKYKMDFRSSTGRVFHDFNTLYENAKNSVLESVKTSKSARSQQRLREQFFTLEVCPMCHGSRFNPKLLTQLTAGKNIAQISNLPLSKLPTWVKKIKAELPDDMQKMARAILVEFHDNYEPLVELGLDYLTLARSGSTLSTGELQRIQLARTLRTQTTGVLYVLDEPSIGLHPDNISGLLHVFHELVDQGNSLVVVDHNVDIIKEADWIIELGPGSGVQGGQVIAQGTPEDLTEDPDSLIGPYISGKAKILVRQPVKTQNPETINLHVKNYFNLKDVSVQFPINELTAVTGFSGAGKTSLILDSLVKGMKNKETNKQLPKQVVELNSPLKHVVSVNATPVGKSTRSTVATYTTIMDNLRQLFAAQPLAIKKGYNASSFSYNNKEGACPNCGGSGVVTLDIQYLPDMQETCPVCHGDRYNQTIQQIRWNGLSIVDILKLDVRQALPIFEKEAKIERDLRLLLEVGLGYLHLGESTPALSGGEAQRLKLVKHLSQRQETTLFVFDEPTIGLHPIDVGVLIQVMQKLLNKGATIIVITHDLNVIANADYMVDLGPRGGELGGKIVAKGEPMQLLKDPKTLTTKYLARYWNRFNR